MTEALLSSGTLVAGDQVVFCADDYRRLEAIARDRWQPKKKRGVRDQTRSHRGTAVSNLVGVLGELAFGLWAGLEIPIVHHWGALHGDGGVDGHLQDGRSYQIKTSSFARAALTFAEWRDIARAEVVVLATVDVTNLERRVSLRGWIEALRFCELADCGKPVPTFPGEVYFVRQNQLRPMRELKGEAPCQPDLF